MECPCQVSWKESADGVSHRGASALDRVVSDPAGRWAVVAPADTPHPQNRQHPPIARASRLAELESVNWIAMVVA